MVATLERPETVMTRPNVVPDIAPRHDLLFHPDGRQTFLNGRITALGQLIKEMDRPWKTFSLNPVVDCIYEDLVALGFADHGEPEISALEWVDATRGWNQEFYDRQMRLLQG